MDFWALGLRNFKNLQNRLQISNWETGRTRCKVCNASATTCKSTEILQNTRENLQYYYQSKLLVNMNWGWNSRLTFFCHSHIFSFSRFFLNPQKEEGHCSGKEWIAKDSFIEASPSSKSGSESLDNFVSLPIYVYIVCSF